MAKINKTYPAFFSGVTQQVSELVLDSQCKEMENCIPDIVKGLTKRPPVEFKTSQTLDSSILASKRVFHTYDRGEGSEEYIMVWDNETTNPIKVYNKEALSMNVTYGDSTATAMKSYLSSGALKALTVQDRTWLFSKNVKVGIDYSATSPLEENYDKTAYYWLKRGSGDKYNPFNYAVHLDGTVVQVSPEKPSTTTNPPTGAEDSDFAAKVIADRINGTDASGWNPNLSKVTDFVCSVIGSIIKINKIIEGGAVDFTFSSWDSWGNQASEGWKGSVNKLSDLPKDMVFSNVYVRIEGEENNGFSDYFVKWNGSSWEECLDPKADRGQLSNMPLQMDRVSIVDGIATFHISKGDWSVARAGTYENNPNPSFAPDELGVGGRSIQDMFFYKNRLGIVSEDSVTLSEAASYTNFFATSVLDITATDPIDITVATNQASRIYFAKPFNNSLYIFTKYAQYELVGDGGFTPTSVSLINSSNYPMAVDVEPVVVNDSLYFISTTNNKQQLREYIRTESLQVKGLDLNVSTPTYLEQPVRKLIVEGTLGYVLCCTDTNVTYLYNFKEDGTKRVQSSWSKWEFLKGLTTTGYEYDVLGASLLVMCKTTTDYRYHRVELDLSTATGCVDTSKDFTKYPYESKVVLPDFYPKSQGIRTPKDKILLKKMTVSGEGLFDVEVYRKDYNKTYFKSHTDSLKDLDLHIASKVGNVVLTVKDSTENNFTITSFVLEGLYNPTSRQIK